MGRYDVLASGMAGLSVGGALGIGILLSGEVPCGLAVVLMAYCHYAALVYMAARLSGSAVGLLLWTNKARGRYHFGAGALVLGIMAWLDGGAPGFGRLLSGEVVDAAAGCMIVCLVTWW